MTFAPAGDAFGGGFMAWWSERGLDRDDLGEIDLVVEATRFACLARRPRVLEARAAPPWRDEL